MRLRSQYLKKDILHTKNECSVSNMHLQEYKEKPNKFQEKAKAALEPEAKAVKVAPKVAPSTEVPRPIPRVFLLFEQFGWTTNFENALCR